MKKEKYAIGTAENGTVENFATEARARAEAKHWAAGEPGTTVIVFWLDPHDGPCAEDSYRFDEYSLCYCGKVGRNYDGIAACAKHAVGRVA